MSEEIKKVESPRVVTLQELGNNLALGFQTKNGFVKSFEMSPWRLKQEKEIGEIAEENPDANMGEYISMIVAHMCPKVGPHIFEKMPQPEKRVHISQMYMGDVFTVYCALRKKAMGNLVPMELKCSRCKKSRDFKADLNTLEVTVADGLDELLWEYKLQEPVKIRGKEVTKMILGPARWELIEAIDAGYHMGTAKESTIKSHVIQIPELGGPVALVNNELDELAKIDVETLTTEIEDRAIGPDMSISDKCPNCKADNTYALDWRYDNFFGVSSSR